MQDSYCFNLGPIGTHTGAGSAGEAVDRVVVREHGLVFELLAFDERHAAERLGVLADRDGRRVALAGDVAEREERLADEDELLVVVLRLGPRGVDRVDELLGRREAALLGLAGADLRRDVDGRHALEVEVGRSLELPLGHHGPGGAALDLVDPGRHVLELAAVRDREAVAEREHVAGQVQYDREVALLNADDARERAGARLLDRAAHVLERPGRQDLADDGLELRLLLGRAELADRVLADRFGADVNGLADRRRGGLGRRRHVVSTPSFFGGHPHMSIVPFHC